MLQCKTTLFEKLTNISVQNAKCSKMLINDFRLSFSTILLFLFQRFIYLKGTHAHTQTHTHERKRGSERERESTRVTSSIFWFVLLCPSHGHLKTRTRKFILISHICTEAQGLGPSSTIFPCAPVASRIKSRAVPIPQPNSVLEHGMLTCKIVTKSAVA